MNPFLVLPLPPQSPPDRRLKQKGFKNQFAFNNIRHPFALSTSLILICCATVHIQAQGIVYYRLFPKDSDDVAKFERYDKLEFTDSSVKVHYANNRRTFVVRKECLIGNIEVPTLKGDVTTEQESLPFKTAIERLQNATNQFPKSKDSASPFIQSLSYVLTQLERGLIFQDSKWKIGHITLSEKKLAAAHLTAVTNWTATIYHANGSLEINVLDLQETEIALLNSTSINAQISKRTAQQLFENDQRIKMAATNLENERRSAAATYATERDEFIDKAGKFLAAFEPKIPKIADRNWKQFNESDITQLSLLLKEGNPLVKGENPPGDLSSIVSTLKSLQEIDQSAALWENGKCEDAADKVKGIQNQTISTPLSITISKKISIFTSDVLERRAAYEIGMREIAEMRRKNIVNTLVIEELEKLHATFPDKSILTLQNNIKNSSLGL